MDYRNVNDYEVVYMIRENDEDARDLMFRKYLPIIRKISLKYLDFARNHGAEMEDLMQESLIALNRAIDRYQENSGALFYTYACLCIERHLITYCRNISSNRYSLLNQSVSGDEIFAVAESDSFDYCFCCDEENFVQYKNLLDFKYSVVFELRYNGFSYREISQLLDIPISTIDGRLCKIRKILQERGKNYFYNL